VAGSFAEFSELVLAVVDRIPRGRVMTYGGIAAYLERGGPRGVGSVMSRDGQAVTWWRVVRADGGLAPHLMIEAQLNWQRERTPVRRGLVDLERARWWPDDHPGRRASRV
jgi:methylated-DNA-protein-cysteine methyltransferase related protein